MEAEGSAEPPIAPAPWRFFGFFLGVQKETRRPLAAKAPREKGKTARRVVAQASFSCPYGAIHLLAPYRRRMT